MARLSGPPLDPAAVQEEDELNSRLFFRLFQAANAYEREVQKALHISAVQGAILLELARRPGRCVPFAELVEHLAFSRQNLDGVLKRLEKLAYVERIEDATNRRARIVRLTPKGARAWRSLSGNSEQFHRASTADLSLAHRRALVEQLGKLNRTLTTLEHNGSRRRRAPSV